jgi:hypothetical protein
VVRIAEVVEQVLLGEELPVAVGVLDLDQGGRPGRGVLRLDRPPVQVSVAHRLILRWPGRRSQRI